jgi:hypothetical protein
LISLKNNFKNHQQRIEINGAEGSPQSFLSSMSGEDLGKTDGMKPDHYYKYPSFITSGKVLLCLNSGLLSGHRVKRSVTNRNSIFEFLLGKELAIADDIWVSASRVDQGFPTVTEEG